MISNVIPKTLWWALVVAGLLGGCGREETYDVCVLNKTDGDVDEVTVAGARSPVDVGVLVRGGADTESSFVGPAPRTLTVSWRDTIRNSHRVEVSLDGVTPRHFNGTIYLILRPRGVAEPAAARKGDFDTMGKIEKAP